MTKKRFKNRKEFYDGMKTEVPMLRYKIREDNHTIKSSNGEQDIEKGIADLLGFSKSKGIINEKKLREMLGVN